MPALPFVSLGVALAASALAVRRRAELEARPWLHWFVYLHVAAVGFHQFEEYGWPGGFRDAFADAFGAAEASALVPPASTLEQLNVFALLPAFGIAGWVGTRLRAIGLGVLYVNFANAFFHLVGTVTRGSYVPGVVTGAALYIPLALLATRDAVRRAEVGGPGLVATFAAGTLVSFAPFLHIRWLAAMAR